ncbi:MAG: hypothetical protein ABL872_15750 [Lacibacter sp.]
MRKNILFFIFGFICSTLIMGSIFIYQYERKGPSNSYFRLNRDYKIEDIGILRKGTVLKFDEGMDEGFDRFILYLNLKGGDVIKDKTPGDVIHPYWLIDVNEK